MRFNKLILSLLVTVPAALAKTNGPCSSGKKGICINTGNCDKYGGSKISGFCPNDPNQVKCCTNISCSHGGRKGTCMFTNECTGGTSYAGHCPGGSNFKCCIKNTDTTKGVGSSCSFNGISGKCINTSTSSCSNSLVSGKCPGPNNVKCCLNQKIDGNTGAKDNTKGVGSSCSFNGISGKCINTKNSSCSNSLVSGKCPGPNNVKCCLNQKIDNNTGNTGSSGPHNISQKGINLIKEFEGCKLTAYWDKYAKNGGCYTIGYGTTNADKAITGTTITKGLKISQATADEWLRRSVNKKYGPKVDKYNNVYHWTQNEFDALCSFAYNIGSIDGLVDNGKRSKSSIPTHMLAYNKGTVNGKKQELKGLTRRRNAEVKLFRGN